MKLSDIKGEKAIETLAELIEPLTAILADEDVKKAVDEKKPRPKIVSIALKRHPREVITCLALLDGSDPETYEVNLVTLPAKILELLNDDLVTGLFT